MRSLRQKLLLLFLPLCLIPLIGISFFSYFQAKQRITEDRIALYLEQISRGVADTIRLTLLEKLEETIAMGLSGEFKQSLAGGDSGGAQRLINQLLLTHEVYDLIILHDVDGRVVLTNNIDRRRLDPTRALDPALLDRLRGESLLQYTPEASWLQKVRSGRVAYLDWHRSALVQLLYDYREEDAARQYSIGFAAPVVDDRGVVIGGMLSLMNWEYVQEILDQVEEEFEVRSLRTGYAFLFGVDGDTIIGHKYRRNRQYENLSAVEVSIRDNYGTSLIRDHHLDGLAAAVRTVLADPLKREADSFAYEYPPGTAKISGLAAVDHEFFEWVVGVGIDDQDIFAPVRDLKNVLILAALLSSALVVVITFMVSRQITTPLKKLTVGASIVAGGDLSQRVDVSSKDEIGELGRTFNEMAESLEERSQALIDLNQKLEEKVRERTGELESSHRQVEQGYQELKETQVQLVQSEKMASLGQLVAGIAHEIKNPLNFIYGNTDFLKSYVGGLRSLLQFYEKSATLTPSDDAQLSALKEHLNYDFLLEDLDTLVGNFEEGAERIHAIIGDLRAFSRMDTDELRPVDIHEPLDTALNLLRNEYRDRVSVHKDYGSLPKVQCNSGKISQVFMNVLANACQAIRDRGDIWIKSFREDGMAIVEIEDNGDGIPEEYMHKVFEPFFTTKSVGQGTGLGLSISYGIIQQHRGKISVSRRPAGGTSFRIQLPLQEI